LSMRIQSIIKITPTPEKRNEILDILHSVKGPTQAINGCLSCYICEEVEDERIIFYMEQWGTWEEFILHIQSDLYTRILEAVELSLDRPDFCFFEVSAMKGLELIEAVRDTKL